jgi:enediyne biosynthesis protein E4
MHMTDLIQSLVCGQVLRGELLFAVTLVGTSALSAQKLAVTHLISVRAEAAGQQGANAQGPAGEGMASAGPQKPTFDRQHRPITAGGFVKTGHIVFQNIAVAAGLARWHEKTGTPAKQLIVESQGAGVCLLDYDNDGWLDIYLVNGSTYGALDGKETQPHAGLFHNNHDGTFTEVTHSAGVANDRGAWAAR